MLPEQPSLSHVHRATHEGSGTGLLQDFVFSLRLVRSSLLGPRHAEGSPEGGQAHVITSLSLCLLDFEQCYYTTVRSEKQFCPQGHLLPRPRTSVAPLQSHPPLLP